MISIGDVLLKMGLDKKDFDRDMKGLSGAINKHKKAIGVAMVGMGVAAVAAAAASIKAFADMGDEVQKMALRTDFATETLSEYRHVANISGADITTLEKGVKKMSKTIVDADEGMATYVRSFDRIGLSAEELMKLSPEEQFEKITMAIADLESPTLRAATAQDIFGRAGTALLPMMAAGSEGIAELRQEARDLGIVFDQEAANRAAEFKDSLTRLDGAITGVKFTLAQELMPALEAGIPILEDWAKKLGPIIENTLNWYAAEDKQIAMQGAWRSVNLERQKFLGGINNEYKKSIDLLEATLRNQGLLNRASIELIETMRQQVKAQEEQNQVLEESDEEFENYIASVEELIEAQALARTEAGKFGLTMDDLKQYMITAGREAELLALSYQEWLEIGEDANRFAERFALSLEDIARASEMSTDDMLRDIRELTREQQDSARERMRIELDAIDERMKGERSAHRERMDQLREDYNQTRKNIDTKLNYALDGYRSQMSAIDRQMDAIEDAERGRRDTERKGELESSIAEETDAGRRITLERRLNELIIQSGNKLWQEERELALTTRIAEEQDVEERERLEMELADFLLEVNARHTREALENQKEAIRLQMDRARKQAESAKERAQDTFDHKAELQEQEHEKLISQMDSQREILDRVLEETLERYDADLEAFEALLAQEETEMEEFVVAFNELIDQLKDKTITITTKYRTIGAAGGARGGGIGRTIPIGEAHPMPGWQHGGVIPEPTLLTSLRTLRPYAIAGEKGREFITPDVGGRRVNIYLELDGRIIAQAIGQPLVDEIRLRTGAKI